MPAPFLPIQISPYKFLIQICSPPALSLSPIHSAYHVYSEIYRLPQYCKSLTLFHSFTLSFHLGALFSASSSLFTAISCPAHLELAGACHARRLVHVRAAMLAPTTPNSPHPQFSFDHCPPFHLRRVLCLHCARRDSTANTQLRPTTPVAQLATPP